MAIEGEGNLMEEWREEQRWKLREAKRRQEAQRRKKREEKMRRRKEREEWEKRARKRTEEAEQQEREGKFSPGDHVKIEGEDGDGEFIIEKPIGGGEYEVRGRFMTKEGKMVTKIFAVQEDLLTKKDREPEKKE